MKHKILFFISILVSFLVLVSCGQTSKVSKLSSSYPGTFSYTQMLTRHQLDSVCVVEGINSDLSVWIKHTLKDFESGISTNQWLYMTNKNGFIIYDLTQKGDNEYILNKRENKKK